MERAKKEGVEQEKRLFVIRLLTKTNFIAEQIADMAGVSVAFVEQVKKTMPS
ncbi:hypothetical protein WBJ53_18625 [Spirosoma sp. SC4-14]|uniref:hypothetical protein n=1 Tax=Spirosoma sp. SC4-14 TaxID=3128900 RepID=UPI0030CB89C7